MPIYEYVCEACGKLTERMQKMTDPPLRVCPECGARKVARIVSRTTFQLKGGGWYSDLYSTPKKKKEPGGEGASTAAKPASAASGDASKPSGAASKPAKKKA